MGREAKFRKYLSMSGMVAEMRRCFERAAASSGPLLRAGRCFERAAASSGPLLRAGRCFERMEDVVAIRGLKLSDCLMSGLAFSFGS